MLGAKPPIRFPAHVPWLAACRVQDSRLPAQPGPDLAGATASAVVGSLTLHSVRQLVTVPAGKDCTAEQHRAAPATADSRAAPPQALSAERAGRPLQVDRIAHVLPLVALIALPVSQHNPVSLGLHDDGCDHFTATRPLPATGRSRLQASSTLQAPNVQALHVLGACLAPLATTAETAHLTPPGQKGFPKSSGKVHYCRCPCKPSKRPQARFLVLVHADVPAAARKASSAFTSIHTAFTADDQKTSSRSSAGARCCCRPAGAPALQAASDGRSCWRSPWSGWAALRLRDTL